MIADVVLYFYGSFVLCHVPMYREISYSKARVGLARFSCYKVYSSRLCGEVLALLFCLERGADLHMPS